MDLEIALYTNNYVQVLKTRTVALITSNNTNQETRYVKRNKDLRRIAQIYNGMAA